jgi:deoxyribodipyrimidine photo-lyase
VGTALALFTRDLRVRDNPVLAAAHAAGDRVVPLFVLDDAMLSGAHGRPHRFGFLCEALADLDASLRARAGALCVRRGNWLAEVLFVAEQCGASSIHIARDVSAYAQQRLADLEDASEAAVVVHESLTVVPPEAFGKPYVVFTPYYHRWLDTEWRAIEPMPRRVPLSEDVALGSLPKGAAPAGWQGGETAGLAHLKAWTPRALVAYADTRDDPGADATSRLSPYLHFGCVSALEVASRLWERPGSTEYLRQLCWRDFYAQLLWWRPEFASNDVRSSTAPTWRHAPGDLEAWKAGRTGFPFIDAGMRQLRAEGWMHNRARMAVASFLTKDLRIDWRNGAAHFMDLLVDGDIANNQLNWQWVAGTGTDANPYRVLNPTVQGRKHDPDGVYVRRWVRELHDLPVDADVHDPPFDLRRRVGYPEPILDHNEAIEMWRASRAR